jgi:tetratricopeptide (TPR) repeat protein
MNLIVDTVARGEWANQPKPPTQPGQAEDDAVFLDRKQLNTLGYYPPARALVIRGTSRYHPATSVKLEGVGMGGQAAAPGNQRNGPVVIGPGAPADPANKPGGDTAVAANEGSVKPDMIDPNIDLTALKKKLSNDPKRMWNEAIDWTITDPGVIVATAEFLMHMKEYPAAIEVLKGGLRKGLATDDWVHKSLAIALQMGHGTPADVERAVLSGIDLDPTDPKAYIEAAKFEAEQKNYDQALAFCKRAAACDPDQPLAYANALAYAESATDLKTDAVVWAADNLLKRDWNAQDINYHQQVNERLKRLIAKTEAAGKKSDPIRRALAEQTQRDLVIELLWQGQADLDLVVAEPSGSVCSATQKRTTGGGVLKADILDPRDGNNHSEVYTAAMAFSGTYKVSVKKVIGQPLGDSARIKVTRYKGTPKESFDLIAVDLKDNKSVEVAMENGSRTELATVPDENDFRNATTGAPLSSGMSGLGGGFGTAGSVSGSSVTASNPQGLLPVVSTASETRLRGIGSSAADLRASMKINPDRQTATFHINPVFGTGKEVAMPKVPLLPGGEDR